MAIEKLVITNKQIVVDSIVSFGHCEGDQGGALVWVDSDGVFRQIGIASFLHFQGCMGGRPDGYVCVTNFLDGISQHTEIAIEKIR